MVLSLYKEESEQMVMGQKKKKKNEYGIEENHDPKAIKSKNRTSGEGKMKQIEENNRMKQHREKMTKTKKNKEIEVDEKTKRVKKSKRVENDQSEKNDQPIDQLTKNENDEAINNTPHVKETNSKGNDDQSLEIVSKIYERLWKKYQHGNQRVYVKGFTAEQIMYQMKELIDYVIEEVEQKADEYEQEGAYVERDNDDVCSNSGDSTADNSAMNASSSDEDQSADENDELITQQVNSYQTSLDVLKALDATTRSEYELDEEVESDYGEDL